MEDGKPIQLVPSTSDLRGCDGTATLSGGRQASRRKIEALTSFNRRELNLILRIYGRMVAQGEWRDYAIDHMANRALFSVYRRTSETPLYQIIKEPRLQRRQGAFSIVAASGLVLKRGRDLAQVLKLLEKKTLRLIPAGE